MSLFDRKYLLRIKFDVVILKTKQSIRIHDIDDKLHDNSKYIELNFYVFDILSNQSSIIIHFRREIYLIDDLKTHALFNVDILKSKKVIFDINKRIIIFFVCNNLTIFMKLTFKDQRIVRTIKSINKIIISFHICLTILVKIRDNDLSTNKDYNLNSSKIFNN